MRTGVLLFAALMMCVTFSATAGKPPSQYTLTISVQGSGTTNPTPGPHVYAKNTVVAVTAVNNTQGWVFDHWTGAATGSANPVNITMSANKSLTAVFVQSAPVTYTLTMAVSGSGSTTPAAGVHTYNANDVVTVQAIPDAGWNFNHWEGSLTGSTNPTTITMDGNKTVTAVFVVPASWPNSMAVIGDSISQAALADSGIDPNQPERSWSTGESLTNSHYKQILAQNAGISGMNLNNSVNGSRADDLLGQSQTTVSQGVDYVTIEMGGNDLCRENIADVTPLATWEAYWAQALDVLKAGLPDATIVVAATVRVNRLWEIGSGDFMCRYILWPTFSFCNDVLTGSDADRAVVAQANLDYNNILANLCAQRGIFFDWDAYYFNFSRSQINNTDCFHPATSGQEALGSITYDATRF